jgi:hypothetical protein
MNWLSFISNIFTIFASGIAIYLFFFKRKAFSTVFNLLVNYTYQLSLSEVKEKLERLNEYHANDPEQCEKIINILNEIMGQIRGNNVLKIHFKELLLDIENLLSGKRRLTEPKKRALVSEIRERVRHLNIKNIDDFVGENQ